MFVRYGAAAKYQHDNHGWPEVTPQTWRKWVKKGVCPAPQQITPGCKGYSSEMLDELAAQRLSADQEKS